MRVLGRLLMIAGVSLAVAGMIMLARSCVTGTGVVP